MRQKRGKIVGRCCWAAHVVPKKMKPTTTIFRVFFYVLQRWRGPPFIHPIHLIFKQFLLHVPKNCRKRIRKVFINSFSANLFHFFSKFNSNFPLWLKQFHTIFLSCLVFLFLEAFNEWAPFRELSTFDHPLPTPIFWHFFLFQNFKTISVNEWRTHFGLTFF